jgi:hypothetical protein
MRSFWRRGVGQFLRARGGRRQVREFRSGGNLSDHFLGFLLGRRFFAAADVGFVHRMSCHGGLVHHGRRSIVVNTPLDGAA